MARKNFRTSKFDKSVNHGPDLSQFKIVGPFPGNTTPSRPGPYLRESVKRPGKKVWSYWNGRNWGLSGTNFTRMLQRKDKPSGQQSLGWFGVAKA